MQVGTVCYASDQGIAHLPKWFYDVGVIDRVMVYRHGSRPSNLQWYPPDTLELVQRPFSGPQVDQFLRSVDTMLFFETPFDWSFLAYCRKRNVKTVIVPMYECTPKKIPYLPDKWISPSKLDLQYFPNSHFLQIPVPPGIRWQQRYQALRFLHNGGNLGLREHKGTRQILEAFKLLQQPIHLTVRAQDTSGLRRIVSEVFRPLEPNIDLYELVLHSGANLRVEFSPKPYEDLFEGYDVFLMAEKYNGLSLPLIEARAAGMLVVTTDRFPMNDWLPREYLIPVKEYQKASIGGAYLEYHEAVVDPVVLAAHLDSLWERNIEDYSLSGKHWAMENSWSVLKPQWVHEIKR